MKTHTQKPITTFVDGEVARGAWREEIIAPEISGVARPITVFRAQRTTNLITYDWHGDASTFCPPMWWDLGIGSGACNFQCRSCVEQCTWIYTDRGPITAKDLYARFEERTWKVLGYDEHFCAVWTPLLAIAPKLSPKKHLNIKLDTGHQVQVTPDHPMIVARAGHFDGWHGSFLAQHVVPGDWLPIVQKAPLLQGELDSLDLSTMDWGIPIKVKDDTLAKRLPFSTTDIAKQIGQSPSAYRTYPLTQHANFGRYELQEYKDTLSVTGLEPSSHACLSTTHGHSGFPLTLPLNHNFGFILDITWQKDQWIVEASAFLFTDARRMP